MYSETKIYFFILTGVLVFFILAAFIIFFLIFYQKKHAEHRLKISELEVEKQKALLKAVMQAEDSERKRIAENIHDDLGGTLAYYKMIIGKVSSKYQDDKQLMEAYDVLNDIVQMVRDISHDLLPTWADNFNINESLEKVCNLYNTNTSIKVKFVPPSDVSDISMETALGLYKIAVEALNNAVKHSEANLIEVSLDNYDNKIRLTISDNGKGFDKNDSDNQGIGLKNISSRVSYLNGNLKIETAKNKGTTIDIEL